MRTTVDSNLEALVWSINNSKEVNPTQADVYELTRYSGGMTTTIKGPAYAGALSHPPPLLLLPDTTKVTLHYRVRLPMAIGLVQAAEFDLMIALANGDVLNGSCQCDLANGFVWEITKVDPATNDAPWVPTGFKTVLAAGVWHEVSVVWKIDQKAERISCLTITVDGKAFQIPAAMQNQPPQKLAWGPMLILPQNQWDLSDGGGTYSADNDQINVTQE